VPCPFGGQHDPFGRPREIIGDIDHESAAVDAGDDEVSQVALAPIGQLDADAGPKDDVGIHVEKACEVAGVLAPEDGRAGAFNGGKRIVKTRRLISRDDIARRPLEGTALHGTL
jgi:hypothetical protein